MIAPGRVLIPAIRWHPVHGHEPAAAGIERALALGVGGFILFGGPAEAVATLIRDLRSRSSRPLLIGADLERGAGQQFDGATALPPAAALGALDDLAATRRAGALTGREARALGVDWVFAPVADLDVEPANPIVGTRALGADPARVGAHVAAWIEGCQAAGVLACAKHFPGHGRTRSDSHLELPVVDAAREALGADLEPVRAAVAAGVVAIMTAHVAYPALDPAGLPATRSPAIVEGLLRQTLGFAGLVVTDALNMAGATGGTGDTLRASVAALAAGCDVLLCPDDPERVASAVGAAVGRDLPAARLREARARVDAAAARASAGAPTGAAARGPAAAVVGTSPRVSAEGIPGASTRGAMEGVPGTSIRGPAADVPRGVPRESAGPRQDWGRAADRAWAADLAARTLVVARGRPAPASDAIDLVTVDDDLGGPYPPPPRTALRAALEAGGVRVTEAEAGCRAREALVAVYADVRAWKGRSGLSTASRARVAQALASCPDATVLLFGHPRLAGELEGASILVAWGGDPLMQDAAGRWLVRARR